MRPKSLRYQDPAEIKRMLEEKKLKSPENAREFTKRILARRKELKHEWLTTILDRARHGDYHAISYLKRRKSMAPIVSSCICVRPRIQKWRRSRTSSCSSPDLSGIERRVSITTGNMQPFLPRDAQVQCWRDMELAGNEQ